MRNDITGAAPVWSRRARSAGLDSRFVVSGLERTSESKDYQIGDLWRRDTAESLLMGVAGIRARGVRDFWRCCQL